MSESIKLNVQDEIHEIWLENHQIGVICHNGTLSIHPHATEGFVVIDPETTVGFARNIPQAYGQLLKQKDFVRWVKQITKMEMPPTYEKLQEAPLAMLHVVGLIAMVMACQTFSVKVYVKFPETYLHPGQQVELAEFIMWLQKEAQANDATT